MRRSHFAAWAPHCPVCARLRGATPALGLAEGGREQDGDVEAGILVCAEPTCRHEYPILDGIPIIMPDVRRHLAERGIELMLRDDIDPTVLGLLGDALGPDSWFDVVRQGTSTYGWDAYADLDPQEVPGAPSPGAARRCLVQLIALARPWQPRTARQILDLGCAAGRTSFDLTATGDGLVLGVDSNLALLRLARRVATKGEVRYARRRIGTVYDERRFTADLPGRQRVDFWACDVTALPFAAGHADAVVALNLLDCVADPQLLLSGMVQMLRPGGSLLLATPFDWSTRATQVEGWIGGHSQRGAHGGAAEPLLLSLLTEGAHPRAVAGLDFAGQGECDWHTRLHDRAAVAYRAHLVAMSRRLAG